MLATKFLNFLFNEHAGIPIFQEGGLFVSAIDFSMSLAGRVHISVWELSPLKLFHFEQFNLQCSTITTIFGCSCTRVQ